MKTCTLSWNAPKKSMPHHTSVIWDTEQTALRSLQLSGVESKVSSNETLSFNFPEVWNFPAFWILRMEFWAVIVMQTGWKIFPRGKKINISSNINNNLKICVSVCLMSPRNSRFYNFGKKLYEVEISPSFLCYNIFNFYVFYHFIQFFKNKKWVMSICRN